MQVINEKRILDKVYSGVRKNLNDNLIKEIVGILNSSGGVLYLEIDKSLKHIEIEEVNEIQEKIKKIIKEEIQPDISMNINIEYEIKFAKRVFKIEIEEGRFKPYYIKEKGMTVYGSYIIDKFKGGYTSATIKEIKEMLRKTGEEFEKTSFESLRSIEQNLSFNYFKLLTENLKIKLTEDEKRKFGIIGEDGLYTNLALLLSDQCKHILKLTVIEDEIVKNVKEITGSVLYQVEKAFDFIEARNDYNEQIREKVKKYPVNALREILINTIMHRDYSEGGKIEINIYRDQIEFLSPGENLTEESKEGKLGKKQLRNKKLAELFYELKLSNNLGRGIKKAIHCYDEYMIKPVINSGERIFQVILPNVHYYLQEREKDKKKEEKFKNEDRVLKLLSTEGRITKKIIEDKLKLSPRVIKLILEDLLNLNYIEKEKYKRSIYYMIK